MASVLALRDIIFTWPKQPRPVLDIRDFRIQTGEKLFLMGPSGSGKTTLLNLIAGVIVPQRGTVACLDTELTDLAGQRRDRFRVDHMGIIFQQFNLVGYLSVLENTLLPCRFSKVRRQRAGGNSDDEAARLLNELGIGTELHKRAANELSVGQQQRVAVARALIGRPEIIIADEPTSALAAGHRDGFVQLLMAECAKYGATLVFVSHDLALASHFDRVVSLAEVNAAPMMEAA